MATISAFPALQCFSNSSFHRRPSPSTHSSILPLRSTHLPTHAGASYKHLSLTTNTNRYRGMRRVRLAEEDTLIPEQEKASSPLVPVSPSDTVTLYFLAEGTMNETAVPTVTKALEETEGIYNLTVGVSEGIAKVEFVKTASTQAPGVASGLVAQIQSLGFKLQTLSLSLEEEENLAPA